MFEVLFYRVNVVVFGIIILGIFVLWIVISFVEFGRSWSVIVLFYRVGNNIDNWNNNNGFWFVWEYVFIVGVRICVVKVV